MKKDPLSILVKTKEEIEALKKKGVLSSVPEKVWEYNIYTHSGIKLNKYFDTYIQAVEYCRKNCSNHPELHWTQSYVIIKEVSRKSELAIKKHETKLRKSAGYKKRYEKSL